MRPKKLILTMVSSMFAAVALPGRLPAQQQQQQQQQQEEVEHKKEHHHYKLIDIGTLGGPNSSVNEAAQVVSSRGVLVGGSDTTTPDPNFPNSCLLCGSPFITHAFQWREGTRTDLGALPGTNSSFAQWTSNSGLTVGYSEDGSVDPLLGIPEIHAVLWRDGHIEDLGTLEGGYESAAFSVNSLGQVAGVSQNLIPDPFFFLGTQQRTFLWEKGKIKDLGTLGGPDAGLLGIDGNVEINERGHIVACSSTSTLNPATGVPAVEPFLWEPDTMIGLGSLGGTSGCAIFLNNRDQVVGYSNLEGDMSHHPFIWERGRPLVDLGTLGGPNGIAFWINEPGEVVGNADVASPPGCSAPNCLFHAFFWSHGLMTDLGTIAGTDNSNGAAINSKSQVVGASFTSDFSVVDAFLWENGSLADLNSLVSPPSVLHLGVASDINDRGEIAGFGFLPNGEERAFLLVPCDEDHPNIAGCDYDPVDPNVSTDTSRPATRNASAIISGELRARFLPQLGLARSLRNPRQAVSSSPAVVLSPIATLSPTSLTFSVQALGTTSPAKIVTMKNTGTASLTIASIAITGTNAGDFAQTHTCAGSLAVGTSCSISVTFKPTASGTRAAALSITDNASGSPQRVPLNGTGTTAKLSPTSLNFGTVAVGTFNAPKAVTLTNVGATPLTVNSIAIAGTDSGDFAQTHTCGSSLAAGASCFISVIFKPKASGTRAGALSVSDNAAGSPQAISLSGIGTTAEFSPTSLNFGIVVVGTTSAPKAVMLTNIGTSPLTVNSIAITGTDSGDFAQTHTCGSSLAAGASCTISVTFNPKASGARTAALSISDNAVGSPQMVPLTGGPRICIPFGGFCFGPGPNQCCPAPYPHHSFCSDPTGWGTCIES